MSTKRSKEIRLSAEYHQYHLLDSGCAADLGEAWTAQAVRDGIAAARGALLVGTGTQDSVVVEVRVLQAEPADGVEADAVVEGSLEVVNGPALLLGCTDELATAHRVDLEPGPWRVRVAKSGLSSAARKETHSIQIWRQPMGPIQVLTRWDPPSSSAVTKKPSSKGKPKNVKKASQLARHGDTRAALESLLAFADAGDARASASSAELLAYLGRWEEVAARAAKLIAEPTAVYAGNVFDDMCALVRRASAELHRPELIKEVARAVPAGYEKRRDAVLLQSPPAPRVARGAELDAYRKAVAQANEGPRFRGAPDDLGRHLFALSNAFGVPDDLVSLWTQHEALFGFDEAVAAARILAQGGDAERAWHAISSRWSRWWPIEWSQVAPVVLVADEALFPLMSAARREELLARPRGPEA